MSNPKFNKKDLKALRALTDALPTIPYLDENGNPRMQKVWVLGADMIREGKREIDINGILRPVNPRSKYSFISPMVIDNYQFFLGFWEKHGPSGSKLAWKAFLEKEAEVNKTLKQKKHELANTFKLQ